MFHSVRARLTLWYCGVMAVILVAFSMISYVLIARQIRENTEASLADTAREFTAAFRNGESVESSRNVLLDFRYGDREILVLNASGTLVARSRAQTLPNSAQPEIQKAVSSGREGFFTIPGGEDNDGFRAFVSPITVLGESYSVIVVRSLHEQTDRLEKVAGALFLGIPLALVIASAGGYLLARKSLAPVLDMSRKAQRIGADTLDERIVVLNEKDELGVLAATLNGLLSRLEHSFESQRHFMADASHELRTPLSIMQGEADVVLSRPQRSEAEYRESLEIIQKASLRLTRIVQNLFLLARSDVGRYPIVSSRFYLDEVVEACVTSVRTIAAAREIEFTTELTPDMVMTGDEDLIHRLVLNLIDNALKYSPHRGHVSVRLTRQGNLNVLSVSDDGPGIPREERERIFERFYRLDRVRGAEHGGAGLGLPIARWIAEIHSGTIQLISTDEGTTFTVALPSS